MVTSAAELAYNPHLTDIVKHDDKPWYKKPNLRYLYVILIPYCGGAEWTLGFESGMMNNLQAVDSWVEYFNHPSGSTLGLMTAIQSAGMIASVPFNPYFSQWLGRRWTIVFFTALQIILMPLCPESPRWLISRDRGDEAYAILQKYHSEGHDGDEYVRLEYAQIQSSLSLEKEMASRFLWGDIFRDKAMFTRFLIAGCIGFFGQVSGNGLVTYYFAKILAIVGITNNHTIQVIILSYNCWSLLNAVPLAIIAPRFPRRMVMMISAAGMGFCFIAWTIASARFAIDASHAAAITSIVFIFLYNLFQSTGFQGLSYTYLIELYPYTQRTQGLAFKQFVGRAGNFFNAYVNPIALDAIAWKYYMVYCVWIFCECAIVYFLFPETYGRSLEETSFLLEGKEIHDKAQLGVDKVMQKELREHDATA
ncbi:hypothetical protein PFICI_07876 [Pestalotiopsis fici W106-1]|uniref:Major facilitator superfamily (MFS) profile domain-containing protein n=1 Tax=Pestalotiopsis fici (strain W106-1 / CGMCC3.15140) TaxID=1229662 RepID=W3X4N6_PESFW|nr:uncharacterized protein PFICI_07876 [Pestalotiopsis fici W106-1]ETS80347.1 hypothetical protein PFICI_07876 [Pestalotiopsis fici W106-1]